METKVPQGNVALRDRVLSSDRALHGCPPAGSLVYPSTGNFGCADSDSRTDECELVACSINESGLPYFTIPRDDLESVSVAENDDTAGNAGGDGEGGPMTCSEPRYSPPPGGSSGQHSVCQFFQDGTYEYVRRLVGATEAADAAIHYSSSVGAQLGMTRRVVITDGGDCINWEWRFGEGVVFPPPTAVPTHAA